MSGGGIYLSNNYGATWANLTSYTLNGATGAYPSGTTTSSAWNNISMSANGQYQTAAVVAGAIYQSSNFGITWAIVTGAGTGSWISLAMSSSGQYQTASLYSRSYAYSSDYGLNWTTSIIAATANSTFQNIAVSSSGQYQTAVFTNTTATNGTIWISTNYGVLFTSKGTTQNYQNSAVSASGQYQSVCTGNSGIYWSSDYGQTWTQSNVTSGGYSSIAMSSSGQYQVAAIWSGLIWYSTNYGVTWTSVAGTTQNWYSNISISANGQYILGTSNATANYVYLSTTRSPSLFTSGSIIANTGINCIGTGAVTAAPVLGSITNASVVITTSSSTAGTLSGNAYGLIVLPSGNGTIHLQSQSISGGGTNAYNMTLNSMGGYVGIGTTAPGFPLQVLNTITSAIGIGNGTNAALLYFNDISTAGWYMTTGGYQLSFNSFTGAAGMNGSGVPNTANTYMVINGVGKSSTAGYVGIGTNNPTSKLHVDSGTVTGLNVLFYTSGLTAGQNTSIGIGKSFSGNNCGTILWNHVGDGSSSNYLGLGAFGGDNKLNILASGNVGIGTNAPPYQLSLMTTNTSAAAYSYVYSTQIITGSPTAGYGYGGYLDGGTQVAVNSYLAIGLVTGVGAGTKSQKLYITDGSGATVQVTGSFSASVSKTFDIPHPLYPNTKKHLLHSCIEGPRCDLIYRGTKQLINGTITIDINKECTYNPEGSMDDGTFEALCANAECFLQNKSGFDRVIGSIQGAILTITCENNVSSDIINWMVIAERIDTNIKEWNRTDSNGFLITQYTNIQ